MADNNEEEDLDSLLKSMVDNIGEPEVSQSYDDKENSLEESYDSSEDDDMAMLSRMLLEDNDIPFDVDLDSVDEPKEDALVEPIVEPLEDMSDIFSEDFLDDMPEEIAEELPEDIATSPTEDLAETPESPTAAADEIDFLSSDFSSYMSLDDLLSEATNNDTGNIEIPEGLFSESDTSTSSVESSEPDEYDPFGGESLFDEDITENLDAGSMDNLSKELSLNDSDFDIFADFAEIDIDSNKKNSAVNEEAVKDAVYNPPVDNSGNFEDDFQKELADILSLDEGMSLDDIPDVSDENALSQDELDKISEITETSQEHIEEDSESEDEEEVKPKKKKKSKKPKKEKVKKAKEPKEKKKFSLKEFFAKFNDEEEEQAKATDNNQELIDKLYKDKDSLDDEDLDSGKSSKKKAKKPKKEKKPKKPKKEKVKKEKVETPDEKIQIGNIGVAIIALLVIVFLFGGFFGVRFIHYKLTIREAKNYFEVGNYDMAYDQIAGMDIKSGDEKFYNQVRLVMIVYQGYESYNNYIELDNEAAAIDALINAVGRKQHIEAQVIKYGVENEVNKVYDQILKILEYYGVNENYAIELYRMEDYDDYYEILEELEPNIDDNNK